MMRIQHYLIYPANVLLQWGICQRLQLIPKVFARNIHPYRRKMWLWFPCQAQIRPRFQEDYPDPAMI